VNVWQIQQDRFDPKKLNADETIYTIGNGYFATRGSFEEGYLGATPATLLYGVFDTLPIGKEELANVPDWLRIVLFVNDERFRLDRGKILEFSRALDLRNGVLTRHVRWESPSGIRIKFDIERFASLEDEHVGAIRYSATIEQLPEGMVEANVTVRASLNTAVGNHDILHWETIDQGHDGNLIWLYSQTRHSHVRLVQAMSFDTTTPGFHKNLIESDIAPAIHLGGCLSTGETITAEKIVVMYTSRDVSDLLPIAMKHIHQILKTSDATGHGTEIAVADTQSQAATQDKKIDPYLSLRAKNDEAWQKYWQQSDIIIEGDDKAQQAIHYNIYQLRISVAPDDSRYSIAAKGLTGFGYRGHVFHDTEIFMLPYYIYEHPDIARNLLLYRYRLLPAARAKAEHNGYQGAQYPWESTLDGQEATPISIVHPESGELIPVLNGHIEIHITASVAFATWHYWFVSGDDEFMRDYGAEILLNTAKFWGSRASYNAERDDYEINDVIGPDEWHEHVNNNVYTNYMAKWNIQTAIDVLHWLRKTSPSKEREMERKLDLTGERLTHWREVAEKMRIPQNEQTHVFEQFDGFFDLEHLDQQDYRGRTASYQAILGVKPVQQYQIIKQADVLMMLTLLRDHFDLDTKRANWEYYYPITDHDYGSSLTPALHVILACELGYVDTAYNLFMKGALVDLENPRGNSAEGIHLACCGAVWQATVFGFAGLTVTDEGYTTNPCLPEHWTRLAFKFLRRGEEHFVDLRR
jgi:trehalose/maltose hydrolase-like predicted phosphorylase